MLNLSKEILSFMKEIKLSVTIDNKLAAITITQNDITGLFGLELNIFLRIEGLNEIELYEILLGKRDLSLFGEDYKDVRIIEYKTSFPILFGYRGSTTYKNLTLKELLESIDNYRDWIYYDNGYIFDYSSLNGEFKTDIPFFKDIYIFLMCPLLNIVGGILV